MRPAEVTRRGNGVLEFLLYNTLCRVQLGPGENDGALEAALQAAQQVQELLDAYDLDSALSRLNRTASGRPVRVSGELMGLLSELERAFVLSRGAYDATLGPVIALWSFGSGPMVPCNEALAQALERTGFCHVRLNREECTVSYARPGVAIDAGGAGKGYAAQRICHSLRAAGVAQAVIDLGGSLCLLGNKPWQVGVQQPWTPRGHALGRLELANCAVSTSSGYERYFTKGGRLYHHLLDPRTGFPAESGIFSATVVCSSPLWADILSTIFFVGGEETGKAALGALGLPGLCGYLLVDAQGELRISPSLLPRFTLFERQAIR